MTNRIYQLDYLKCVFIILMVMFHLAYFGDKYHYAKQIVYTFHMPAFLIISGYLANVKKEKSNFIYSTVWIFIPYAIMEFGYVLMSAILPVREKVGAVTFSLVFDKIFVTPMGPYWYLHTLIICYLTYYIIIRFCSQTSKVSLFIILGICFWILSEWLNLLSMANAIYFIIGIVIYQSKQNFLFIFQPSAWAIVPIVILCCYSPNLNRFTLSGILITYLIMCFLLWIYNYIPNKAQQISHFIGCNTLAILLFSPIFTIISKTLIPLCSFDKSGLCFMFIAVVFVISGSFALAWCMDKIKISRWLCGKTYLLTHRPIIQNSRKI